jgi:hypothetical protein
LVSQLVIVSLGTSRGKRLLHTRLRGADAEVHRLSESGTKPNGSAGSGSYAPQAASAAGRRSGDLPRSPSTRDCPDSGGTRYSPPNEPKAAAQACGGAASLRVPGLGVLVSLRAGQRHHRATYGLDNKAGKLRRGLPVAPPTAVGLGPCRSLQVGLLERGAETLTACGGRRACQLRRELRPAGGLGVRRCTGALPAIYRPRRSASLRPLKKSG